MSAKSPRLRYLVAILVTGSVLVTPVLAAKPDDAGRPEKAAKGAKVERGNSGKARKQGASHGSGSSVDVDSFFGDPQRQIIRDYYGQEFQRGRCPPGLAKKHNGCLPPGQARKWRVGYPLPHDVVYYDLPHELLGRLGRTPEGYKLVRVGVDILKIVVGTGLVIEAVEDLGGLF